MIQNNKRPTKSQRFIQTLHKEIGQDYRQLLGGIKALLGTISVKDLYTRDHCERVALYATWIGEAMNLDEKRMNNLQYAALLHDIGKIEISRALLHKTETLSSDDWHDIRRHPEYSAAILETISGIRELVTIVKHHHERFDGCGYPSGLSGYDIPLEARIISVADSFDAMLSERPYSSAMKMEAACEELQRCSGSQFDPDIAKLFISVLLSIKPGHLMNKYQVSEV